jgi:selenocysteine lyase/cysteine desulfurase
MSEPLSLRMNRRDFSRLLGLGGGAALWARSAPAEAGPALDRPRPLAPAPARPTEAYWATVKEQFALPARMVTLNAANLCPAPLPVLEAVFNATDLDHDLSPANRTRMHEAKEATRQLLAEFLNVSPDEILITRNTSESNNLVSTGLDLKAGDEVLVFADNHPSNHAAWSEKARRAGFTARVIAQKHPHPGPDYYLEVLAREITPRTRLVALTHLTNTVGDLFPVQGLCALAREKGVLSLVDGAQSFGLMEVDLRKMGADFYSGSAHKWLCGPKEAGVLYVRQEVQGRLTPSIVSLYAGATGISKTFEGFGQRDEPALLGFGEAVRFQTKIGRAAIEARGRALAAALQEGLRRLPGVTVWTHPDPARSHSVVAFQPAALDPRKLAEALYQSDGIVSAVRPGPDRPGLRLAPHILNLHADVERALDAIGRYLSRGV